MNLRTLFVTAALVFVVSGVARAAELSTAPMFTAGDHFFQCSIANVSSVPQTVRVRIYNYAGVLSTDTGDFVLPARAARWVGSFGQGHCRFTTVNGKALFRAAIQVIASGTVIASHPAQ